VKEATKEEEERKLEIKQFYTKRLFKKIRNREVHSSRTKIILFQKKQTTS
jgi:hypothetical protein